MAANPFDADASPQQLSESVFNDDDVMAEAKIREVWDMKLILY